MSHQTKQLYEFGRFRLDVAERLLLCEGKAVPLTPKAFDLLLALVARHGRLLGKEELFRAVWPDSFVEESNLSSNIALIRKALGDGENGQKFIETVPKRGYRFVAEVREVPSAEVDGSLPEKAGSAAATHPTAATSFLAKHASRRARSAVIFALGAFGVVVGAAVWWIAIRRSPELPPPRIVPFTSLRGYEVQPSFSPDGNQIAFVWDGEQGDNPDIYVKQLGNESRLRLTTNPAADTRPCWSPDGRYIAFTRELPEGAALYLIPSLGGPERRITPLWSARIPYQFRISWSPDGEWLAVMDKSLPAETPSIYLVARATGEKRKLTAPPTWAGFDHSPDISPDGRTVAFVRLINNGIGDLYLVPTAGGEAQRLTFDNALTASPVWTPDNREILFLSMRAGAYSLWRVPATGGTPAQVEMAGRNLTSLAISRQGRRLAWAQDANDYDIWRMELADAASSGGRNPSLPPSKLLISSTGYDLSPEFSPDGKSIAFASTRSGNFEIWVTDSTGERSVQLTAFDRGITGSPRWSPDSRRIVFDARPADSADIYVIGTEGGQPRRLTTDPAEDIVPSWSRDGSWIYFSSKRGGTSQIWRMPSADGEAVQVTRQGGFESCESPDGQFLYYTKVGAPGIWRRPVMGGEETLVLDHHQAGFWRYWTVVERGIYFATAERPEQPLIEFFSFATSQVTPVAVLEKGLNSRASGLAVSPDGRWLIWTQRDQVGSDIMLLENFR
jgi:Tol biopolymer transport system component/DNA-binding winged helix-turn-helix (wHTH) protein